MGDIIQFPSADQRPTRPDIFARRRRQRRKKCETGANVIEFAKGKVRVENRRVMQECLDRIANPQEISRIESEIRNGRGISREFYRATLKIAERAVRQETALERINNETDSDYGMRAWYASGRTKGEFDDMVAKAKSMAGLGKRPKPWESHRERNDDQYGNE